MTPLQFVDWLDGALDLDELAQTVHGAFQIHPELREMIRRRMQSVDRTEVEAEAAMPEVKVTPPADKLSAETLAEIRESLSRRMAESDPMLSPLPFKPVTLGDARSLLLRSPMSVVNTANLV